LYYGTGQFFRLDQLVEFLPEQIDLFFEANTVVVFQGYSPPSTHITATCQLTTHNSTQKPGLPDKKTWDQPEYLKMEHSFSLVISSLLYYNYVT
jgi:hypothetical protein